MTMKQVVTSLQASGHKVRYTVRKDGGIRITNLDGISYRGSTGNAVARAMTGEELSTRRTAQLKTIRSKKGQFGHKRRVAKLPDETIKRIRRIQRKFRQEGINRTGIVTQRNYRYILKTLGKEEAERRLAQAERYASGLAYTENVDALVMRLELDLDKRRDSDMKKIQNLIKSKRAIFKEKWIQKIYEILYLWEHGQISGEAASAQIKAIMES